jgi:hypothetical protein
VVRLSTGVAMNTRGLINVTASFVLGDLVGMQRVPCRAPTSAFGGAIAAKN